MEFADHLWLTFLDQPDSDIMVFAIITFHRYNIIVTKWKHVIGSNDITKFNKELEFLSASIKKLVIIDESWHKIAIVISITEKYT